MTLGLMDLITGVVGAVLGIILTLIIVGNASIVAQINAGLSSICNTGWPLSSLFNPTTGIVPLLLIVGLFLASIVGAIGIGKVARKRFGSRR